MRNKYSLFNRTCCALLCLGAIAVSIPTALAAEEKPVLDQAQAMRQKIAEQRKSMNESNKAIRSFKSAIVEKDETAMKLKKEIRDLELLRAEKMRLLEEHLKGVDGYLQLTKELADKTDAFYAMRDELMVLLTGKKTNVEKLKTLNKKDKKND